MKYRPTIEDIHDDWHAPTIEAATPIEALEKVAEYCRHENIFPRAVVLSDNDPSEKRSTE